MAEEKKLQKETGLGKATVKPGSPEAPETTPIGISRKKFESDRAANKRMNKMFKETGQPTLGDWSHKNRNNPLAKPDKVKFNPSLDKTAEINKKLGKMGFGPKKIESRDEIASYDTNKRFKEGVSAPLPGNANHSTSGQFSNPEQHIRDIATQRGRKYHPNAQISEAVYGPNNKYIDYTLNVEGTKDASFYDGGKGNGGLQHRRLEIGSGEDYDLDTRRSLAKMGYYPDPDAENEEEDNTTNENLDSEEKLYKWFIEWDGGKQYFEKEEDVVNKIRELKKQGKDIYEFRENWTDVMGYDHDTDMSSQLKYIDPDAENEEESQPSSQRGLDNDINNNSHKVLDRLGLNVDEEIGKAIDDAFDRKGNDITPEDVFMDLSEEYEEDPELKAKVEKAVQEEISKKLNDMGFGPKEGENSRKKLDDELTASLTEKAQEVLNIPDSELGKEYLNKYFERTIDRETRGEYYIDDIPSPYDNYEGPFQATLDASSISDDIIDFFFEDRELGDIPTDNLSEKQLNKFIIDNFDVLFERYKEKLAEKLGEDERFIDSLIEEQEQSSYDNYVDSQIDYMKNDR